MRKTKGLTLALAAFQDILKNSRDHYNLIMVLLSNTRHKKNLSKIIPEFWLTEKEVNEFKYCEGNVEKCIDLASKRFGENEAFAFLVMNYLNSPILLKKSGSFEIIESPFISLKRLPSIEKFLKAVPTFEPHDITFFGEKYYGVLEEKLKENMVKGVNKVSENHWAYSELKLVLDTEFEFINKRFPELQKTGSQPEKDYIIILEKLGKLRILFDWLKKMEIAFFTDSLAKQRYRDLILKKLTMLEKVLDKNKKNF
jgi:hypothetical protein